MSLALVYEHPEPPGETRRAIPLRVEPTAAGSRIVLSERAGADGVRRVSVELGDVARVEALRDALAAEAARLRAWLDEIVLMPMEGG